MRMPLFGAWAVGLALLRPPAWASERVPSPWVPDFVRVQYAGQAGLLSAGPGYSWWHRKVEISASYGYVPGWVADRRAHVLTERNSFSLGSLRLPRRLRLEPALAGFAANVSLGHQYQLFLPKAQRDYYWPDALYFWIFAGTRLDYLSARSTYFRALGAQIEIGTINQYLEIYANDREADLGDILSLAISAQVYL